MGGGLCSRHLQIAAGLMPTRPVTDENAMSAGRDLSADLLQVFVHRFRVGCRHDDGCPHPAIGADRAEQVSRSWRTSRTIGGREPTSAQT